MITVPAWFLWACLGMWLAEKALDLFAHSRMLRMYREQGERWSALNRSWRELYERALGRLAPDPVPWETLPIAGKLWTKPLNEADLSDLRNFAGEYAGSRRKFVQLLDEHQLMRQAIEKVRSGG